MDTIYSPILFEENFYIIGMILINLKWFYHELD